MTQAPKGTWYMFTDSWNDTVAKKNPLRWGGPFSVGKLVHELQAHMSHREWNGKGRPVRIYAEMETGHFEREFKDVHSAVEWVQESFSCEEARAPPATRSTSFSFPNLNPASFLVGRCGAPRPLQDEAEDELVVGVSEEPSGTSTTASPHDSDVESEDAAEPVAAESVSPAAQEEAKLQYMWADAGVLPISPMQGLAHVNPLRWSRVQSPTEVVKALEAHASHQRPVKLYAESLGQREEKTFDSVDDAVHWIRESFQVSSQEEDGQGQIQEVHRCVICLEAPVTVMLMPCRHAVLCEDCAVPMLSGTADCPICRTQITNHARGQFAEDYVALVDALEARLERTQASAYDGMYNHVKPLMVTGALLGTGAAACFVLAPAAVPFLATSAFAVGYVPWFATTVAHFEREDLSGDEVTATSFFSREDLSKPLTLIVKVLTAAVVTPLATVAFFIPYGAYAGVIRPLSKAFLRGLVRACCLAHVYALRPTANGLRILTQALIGALQAVGNGVWQSVVVLRDLLVSAGRAAGNALLTIGEALYEHAILPCMNGVTFCRDLAVAGAQNTYNHVLLPVGQGIHRGACLAAHGISTGADATYNHVLLPTGQALQKMFVALGHGLASVASNMYAYVLLPCGKAVVVVLKTLSEGITIGATATYSYVLVPCGAAMWGGLKLLANGIGSGATMLYSNVLVPVGAGALMALSMLAKGIGSGATMFYSNVLVPIGAGALKALSMLANGVAASVSFLYRNTLVPVGTGVYTALQMMANGVTLGATSLYSYVLLPCAAGVGFVAKGIWSGTCHLASCVGGAAVATYSNVLVPLAQAIVTGAAAVYICVLSPCGSVVWAMGAATADAIRAIAHYGALGTQTVHVYVLRPTGQAMYGAAAATGQGMQSCATEVGRAGRSAAASVRLAGQQTVEAMRSSTR